MTPRTITQTVVRNALAGGVSRTRFFDGMLLTQAALEDAHAYHRLKRQLTNRALGQGVVWGLRTELDASGRNLTLHPGYGIDCCGNDLVVTQSAAVSVKSLLDEASDDVRALLAQTTQGPVDLAVMLEYVECPTDPSPVALGCRGVLSDACEYGRIRETTRLRLGVPVAPNCGPVATFLSELDALKTQHPELFPVVTPEAESAARGDVPLWLVVRFGSDQRAFPVRIENAQGTIGLSAQIDEVIAGVGAHAADFAEMHFELRPSPEYLITQGSVIGPIQGETFTELPRVTRTQSPFGMHLAWTWRIPMEEVGSDAGQQWSDELRFSVGGLRIEPLFRRDGGLELDEGASLRLNLSLQTLPSAGGTSAHAARLRAELEIHELSPVAVAPVDDDCLRFFRMLDIACIEGRAEDALKAAVLSALGAFLSNELRTAIASGRAEDAHGPAYLAAWLYTLAWRVFFGGDPAATSDQRKLLAGLIQKLFERWCAALLYPGPRCVGEHGVALGTLRFQGDSVELDVWGGRRYVVTGAWLNHVATQVGVAPLDVIVGRFARAICCIADIPPVPDMGALPPLVHARLTEVDRVAKLDPHNFDGRGGVLHSGAGYLLYGDATESVQRLTELGLHIVRTEPVSVHEFARLVFRAISAPAEMQKAPRYVRYVVKGSSSSPMPQIVVPESTAQGDTVRPRNPRLEALIAASFADQPLAQSALVDWLDATMHGIAIRAYPKMTASDGSARLLLEALDEAHVVVLGQLSGDPETVLFRIGERLRASNQARPALDLLRALINDLHRLEKTLVEFAKKAANGLGTLVRSDLGGRFRTSLQEVIRVAPNLPFMDNQTIAQIASARAESVAARGPQL